MLERYRASLISSSRICSRDMNSPWFKTVDPMKLTSFAAVLFMWFIFTVIFEVFGKQYSEK
jgi:hypothetical protein